MHRFYLPPEHCAGNTFRLDGREAHHALHVLRLKHGEPVIVLDGAGAEIHGVVESITRNAFSIVVTRKNLCAPPPCSITLFQAVPKGKIIESIIQKAVELGVRRVIPILTERVVMHLDGSTSHSKRDKWQQVAIEAIKQCGAAWLPEIEAPVTIDQILARREQFDVSLVGSLQKESRSPRDLLREFESSQNRLPRSVGMWIGPEGDFTLSELAAIQDSGAKPVTLGRLVLRVETAAVFCLSFLNYELQRD